MHCMHVARAIHSTRDMKVNDSKGTRSDYDNNIIVASNCIKTSAQQLLNMHFFTAHSKNKWIILLLKLMWVTSLYCHI